jgi:GNAT superfamily N-acetyltransferase
VSELVEAAYSKWIPVIGFRPRPMDDDYSQVLNEQEGWIDLDGDVVRGAIILRHEGDHLWIENVAVHPSVTGAGLGATLMDHGTQRARDLGVSEMWLYTHELMSANRAIYLNRGWTEFEPSERLADFLVYFRMPVDTAGA